VNVVILAGTLSESGGREAQVIWRRWSNEETAMSTNLQRLIGKRYSHHMSLIAVFAHGVVRARTFARNPLACE
jgi:hypothetical protein